MTKKGLIIAAFVVLALGLALLSSKIFPHSKTRDASPAVKPPAAASLAVMLKRAALFESRNELVKARDLYQSALESYPASGDIVGMQESIDNLNIGIIFSPAVTPDSFRYEVKAGDSLGRIAVKYNTTIDLIMRSNGLKGQTIVPGQKLKIARSKFSIWVSKSDNMLSLKADGKMIKVYRISTGKNDSTPTGAFTVITKIVNPPWYTDNKVIPSGSPDNILGTRWLGISRKGYGIHGTTEPETIGRQATSGCVRMRNSEVEELFALVPIRTEVVIVD